MNDDRYYCDGCGGLMVADSQRSLVSFDVTIRAIHYGDVRAREGDGRDREVHLCFVCYDQTIRPLLNRQPSFYGSPPRDQYVLAPKETL